MSISRITLAIFTYVILFGLAALPRQSATTSPQAYEAVKPHMGTLVRIKLYASNEAEAESALRAAFERIAQLDDILSDYKPGSELNRVCRTAVRHPVEVSDDLFRVVSASQQLAVETAGAFDITVGPLTHLWRKARKEHHMPDPVAMRATVEACGFRKLHLGVAQHTIELDEPGMQLDVGGIAKGYAADEGLTVLSKLGISSALVAASGDLAFSNPPPGQNGWRIGIRSFDNVDAPLTRILVLANGAVSTSGDSEQHLDIAGTRYSHIIDPKTGMGLTHDITVTIVARHGIDSDGMSTAVSVLGAKRGFEYVERKPEMAALIIENGRDHPQVFESSRFRLIRAGT
jgi:thiamine biosynthesis lipoprotein